MQLFLGVDLGEVRAGYEYIDPKLGKDFRNLDPYCADGQCVHLYAPNILDYISVNELQGCLSNWVKKLRHGSKILVGGTDIYEMSRLIVVGGISIQEANHILFGNKPSWFMKVGAYSAMLISDMLSQYGLKILKRQINEHEFFVEAQRD